MILAHPSLEHMIELSEDRVTILTVENPRQLAAYISELYAQMNGSSGDFSLFEDNNEIPLVSMKIIFNPFDLDFDAKDIQEGVFSKIKETLNSEEFYVPMVELSSKISSFLFKVSGEADQELVCSDISAMSLIKLVSPHYECNSESLLESICQYVHVLSKFTKSRVLTFINLRAFLEDEQIDQLLNYAQYEKICLFLIESSTRGHLTDVRETVIDKDLCEIIIR